MTFVFDIDGTICYNKEGDYETSLPYADRIEKINKLYDEGHTIVFFTARGMGRSSGSVAYAYQFFESLTRNQLREWGVKHHALYLGKPSGDVYVDDKGIKDEDFFAN